MRLPDITHGQERQGSIRLTPDIPEQVELSKRIGAFLRAVGTAGITPALRSRSFKDFRAEQPNGNAHIAAAYSDENGGRYSAEVRASHKPSGFESHYGLFVDGGLWIRNDSNSQGQFHLDHDEMVQDMLEYAPQNGDTAALLDRAADADAIMKALFADMSASSHYKSGSDHYRTILTTLDAPGSYASARTIELIEARENRKVTRQLSIIALSNLGAGPVDVTQSLVYEARYGRRGEIAEDAVRLVIKSSDGLSPTALTRLAETSDIASRPTDLLHNALDELSRDTFITGKVA